MNCPDCGVVALASSNFCEDCGAQLKTAPASRTALLEACGGCGASAELIDPEGYCSRCGVQRRAPARDHMEQEIAYAVAGVSDRGLKHYRNEDFFAAAQAGGVLVGVVCDGVSSSLNADEASAAAAPALCETLAERLGVALDADAEVAMKAAIQRAQDAVLGLKCGGAGDRDQPETTVVAAAVIGGAGAREAVLGWLGDSRAYFFGATEQRLLTKDHSWLEEIVDSGRMTYAEAIRCRGAHSVTRTLGGPPPEPDEDWDEPSIVRFRIPEPGWIVLCSDGLWNYAPEPLDLAAVARRSRPDGGALGLARDLVEWAREQGGRDNITVVALAV